MTYLSGREHKKKRLLYYVIPIVFFLLIVLYWVSVRNVLAPTSVFFVTKYSSVKNSFMHIPDFFSTYTSSRALLTEKNKTYEIIIERLENEIAEKNARLKELGVISSEIGDAYVSSTIVMYPLVEDITKLYSTILLSKGFKDGVEKDAYVYVRGLQPVCVIKEVYASTALCELLSSSNRITEAVISNSVSSTTIAVSLNGRGGGAFLADVARDTPISIGDSVFLKHDQSMMIGHVVDVIHNNQDTSWRVFVRGAYNPVTSSVFYMRKK